MASDREQRPTWLRELKDFAVELGHSPVAACWEEDGHPRDPDKCDRCYLEQIAKDAESWLARSRRDTEAHK